MQPLPKNNPLNLYSVIIPARDEEESLPETLANIHKQFTAAGIPHEIVVVDDGSKDNTWAVLQSIKATSIPTLAPVQNPGPHGFGRAIIHGLNNSRGDAVVIMMADASDSPADAIKYWLILNEGWDCVFGSRFIKGGKVVDYPKIKLWINRLANFLVRLGFNIKLNDTTNAFKAYRRTAIDGCRPLIAPHFNLTVELPLKTIVRGFTWTTLPISWQNRKHGVAKLKIKEMGSRYFFICAYVWFEKFFSRGDYKHKNIPSHPPQPATNTVGAGWPMGKLGGVVKWLVLIAPVLFGFLMISQWGINVPSDDDKEIILFCDKMFGPEWSIGGFFFQHNEHRIFFPRIVFFLNAWLAQCNIKLLMFVSWMFATATYLIYLRWLRREQEKLGTSPCTMRHAITELLLGFAIGCSVFNVAQYENILWGFQVAWYMLAFFGILAFYWFHRYCQTWQTKWLALAMVPAVAAAFTSMHGLLVLPIMLGALVLLILSREKISPKVPLIVLGVTVLVFIVYFHGYQKPGITPPLFGKSAGGFVMFFLSALAAPFGLGENRTTAVTGLLILVMAATIVARLVFHGKIRDYIFPVCLFALGAGFCLAITIGRSGFGLWQAFASRYMTFSLIALIGLALMVLTRKDRRGWLGWLAACAIILALLRIAYLNTDFSSLEWHNALRQFRIAVLLDYKNIPNATLKALDMFHTDTKYMEALERRQWSVFHHRGAAPVRAKLTIRADDMSTNTVDGKLTLVCGTRDPSLNLTMATPMIVPPTIRKAYLHITFQNDTDGEMLVSIDDGTGVGANSFVKVPCQATGNTVLQASVPILIPRNGIFIRDLCIKPPKGARFTLINFQLARS